MNTKNQIQLIREFQERKNKFFEQLEELMEKYNINSAIFVSSHNGTLFESTTGYYDIANEYDSLEELKKNFDPSQSFIRVIGSKVQSGTVYSTLKECKGEKVFDITAQQMVEVFE